MTAKVDLYTASYGNYAAEVYRQIRAETYGRDFGQTSWVTTEESTEIPRQLGLRPNSNVLEIGCGSGQYGCTLPIQPAAGFLASIPTRRECATEIVSLRSEACRPASISRIAMFRSRFPSTTFLSILRSRTTVLCHIPDRAALLAEIIRVLKPGARLLFSDALVIGGMVTHHELATRSSIGLYVFTPPGENERLIKETGFRLIASRDTTVNAALIAKRWRDSREKRKNELIAVEGDPTFRDLQEFLSCVHALTKERRLLRYLYVAQKPKRTQARRRKNR